LKDLGVVARPVLLVEDNPMDVDLTRETFLELGLEHPINTCRDGEEALQYMQQHDSPRDRNFPIVVLLDLRLPKVDGMDVLRYARQHTSWKRVPFVILTTSSQSRDVSDAYEVGVNSYLIKPLDSDSFGKLMQLVKSYWLQANQQPFPSFGGHD